KRVAADEHGDALRVAREEERRLAGGVAAADDEYFLIATGDRLGEGGAVIHSGARQRRGARDVERAVRNAGRDEQRARRQLRPVGEGEDTILAIDAQAAGFLRGEHLDTELPSLGDGAPR